MNRKVSVALFGCGTLALLILPLISSGQSAHIPDNIKFHHQRLYSQYYHGKNIFAETKAGRDVDSTVPHFFDSVVDPDAAKIPPTAYPHPNLRGISCDADAVVVATPQASETDITASGDFLYTDSRFQVESILKNTTPVQLEDGGAGIIVTRAGGDKIINGHRVRIQIVGFPQFAIGQRYMLFLGYLPATRTFQAFGVGTFELVDGAAVPFDPGFTSVPSTHNESAFSTEVRAAITAPCTLHFYPRLDKSTAE